MKIVIVTDAWSPQVNGVVTAYERMRALLTTAGHEVIFVHPGQFKTMPMPMYKEIQLSLFPRRKVFKLLTEAKPDAVHIATEGPLGWSARAYCVQKGIPFTTAYHTHFPQFVKARFGTFDETTYAYMRRFHNKAARVMVATEGLKRDLESHGFEKIVLWPLGVDTELFKPLPLSPRAKPVFAYLGRIAVEKNIREFLDAKLPGEKLVIGDGPDREALAREYKEVATFVGYKKGEELAQILADVDVLVFPSRTDTFGLVIVEALSCGVPVAAHEVMGPREILTHGVDGYMSEDIAEAARACLALSREACREKALQFSWEHSAEVFVKNLTLIRQ